MATTTSELVWLQQLLLDMSIQLSVPALLFGDNQAALHIANNPTFHERTKHIDLDCHFVREKVNDCSLKLLSVHSQHQLANLFTKPFSSSQFLVLTKQDEHQRHPLFILKGSLIISYLH